MILLINKAGLTLVEQEQVMHSRDTRAVNLRNQVLREAAAAEQLEAESRDSNDAIATANRAPAATSTGSRSSFTEQPEPPNYSIEIEHVFKVYGPYAEVVTPFFSDLWQQHCQAEYASGRSNVESVNRHQATTGTNGINPNAHPHLRIGTVTINSNSVNSNNSSTGSNQLFTSVVQPFFERMQSEAQDTNYLNARRDEISELSYALRTFAPADGVVDPLVSTEMITTWRRRYIELMNQRPVLPSVRARDASSVAPEAAVANTAASHTTVTSGPSGHRRQRLSSPPRTVPPANPMMAALQQLQSQYTIRECGGEQQCCFRVLNVIEFTLGSSRRALFACNEEDDHLHTRARIARWMRTYPETIIFHFGDNSPGLAVAQAAIQRGVHPDLESYCNWISQAESCGGEVEIASFTAMYGDSMHEILSRVTIQQVQHQNNKAQRRTFPGWRR